MKKIITIIALSGFTLSFTTSCREKKTTGEKIESSLEEAGDAIDDAADDAGDAIEDGYESTKDAVKDATN